MVGLSGKTLTIFHSLEMNLQFFKNAVEINHPNLAAIYSIMETLRFYNNIIYRALKKSRYDRLIELVHRAVNAYCTHFDTPGCEDINPENVLNHIEEAIDLVQSIKERKG